MLTLVWSGIVQRSGDTFNILYLSTRALWSRRERRNHLEISVGFGLVTPPTLVPPAGLGSSQDSTMKRSYAATHPSARPLVGAPSPQPPLPPGPPPPPPTAQPQHSIGVYNYAAYTPAQPTAHPQYPGYGYGGPPVSFGSLPCLGGCG